MMVYGSLWWSQAGLKHLKVVSVGEAVPRAVLEGQINNWDRFLRFRGSLEAFLNAPVNFQAPKTRFLEETRI